MSGAKGVDRLTAQLEREDAAELAEPIIAEERADDDDDEPTPEDIAARDAVEVYSMGAP